MDNHHRFIRELEFVQSLANPAYLQFLARRGDFEDPKMIAYLKYLLYWKERKYLKYITYTNSLSILEMLQEKEFRTKLMIDQNFITHLHRQQYYKWFNG